jgi:hypothetical protein
MQYLWAGKLKIFTCNLSIFLHAVKSTNFYMISAAAAFGAAESNIFTRTVPRVLWMGCIYCRFYLRQAQRATAF